MQPECQVADSANALKLRGSHLVLAGDLPGSGAFLSGGTDHDIHVRGRNSQLPRYSSTFFQLPRRNQIPVAIPLSRVVQPMAHQTPLTPRPVPRVNR